MKTHWKKLNNPDYIGAYELMNGDEATELVVQIESVSKELIKGPKTEEGIIAKLKGQKPLILNATNAKMITKLTDSPYIEDWSGISIILYVAKVRAFGETVDALRIKDELPSKKALTPKHPKWSSAKESIKAGQTTVEAIRQVYTLSDANEKKLLS